MFTRISNYFTKPVEINTESKEIVKTIDNSAINDIKAEALSPKTSNINLADREIQEASFDVDDGKKALEAIMGSNMFTSHADRERTMQMAALAGLMYKNFDEMASIDHLFPQGLFMLPTPEEMGLQLPTGLRVQAFRHGDEVIIGMRGTEITKDFSTAFANLLADAGIGRHTPTGDILESIKAVSSRVKSQYGYQLNERLLEVFESILKARLEGDTEEEMKNSFKKEVGMSALKGGLVGGGVGTLGALGGLACTIGLGALTGGFGPLIVGSFLISGVAAGGGLNAGFTAAKKGVMAADGYATTLNYVKGIDSYIELLKKTVIRNTDWVVTTGHSLSGFLARISGEISGADEAYCINGPGALSNRDVAKIMENLGLVRKAHNHFESHYIMMEGDFIGNFGKRDGNKRTLYLPITLGSDTASFPKCNYDALMSHHGIDLIQSLLKNTTVLSFPKHIKGVPILLLEGKKNEEPQVEEIED